MIKPNYDLVQEPPAVPFLRSAKGFVLKVANRTGVSSALASTRWRQQRLLVLCYHGVSQDDEHLWSDLYISPERFEQRLELMRKADVDIVPLDTAVNALYSGDLPQRAVSITFDDGACDFSSKAVPILTAAQAHSTLYLTTYYCRKDMPVFSPFVSYLLWKGRGRTVLLPGLNERFSIPHFANDPVFQAKHLELLDHASKAGMDAAEKHEFARTIARATGADFEQLCERRILHLMNPEEVRALDPNLVSIQLHTHRHRTPSSLEELREELTRNASEIAAMTGRSGDTNHFCYPSGRYSPEFVEWLRKSGVRSATTCVPNYSTESTSPLEIPRFVDTMTVSADTFNAWIMGTAAFTVRSR